MDITNTAIILIGFQNDYFAKDGALHSFLEPEVAADQVLKNTVGLVDSVKDSPIPIISTPICFSSDYRELEEPTGILETIRDVGAFQSGNSGVKTVRELATYGERIVEILGKRSFNAFSDTELDTYLRERNIENLVLAGVISSVCVDSTGRAASELGYKVLVTTDCTWGRTAFEQDYYCANVFPLYAKLIDSNALANALLKGEELKFPKSNQGLIASLVNQRLFEELAAAETRYRDLVDNLRNIVFGYDASKLLSFVNPAWCEVLGYNLADPIGLSMEEFLVEEDKHLWAEVTDSCSKIGDHARCELRLKTASGNGRWFDLSIRAGEEGGVGLLYDITDSKEKQQRLQETVVQTRSETDEKSRFLATMSHEIRTPMNGVIGMTDLLLRTNLDANQRNYVETLRSSGDAMLVLIDDILDMSKIEAGKLVIIERPENIHRLIPETDRLFRARAEQKKIELGYEVDETLPEVLKCDINRIRQVINNLLSNAIKFTQQGRVHVAVNWKETEAGSGTMSIAVSDTGIGIPSSQQHLLFKPFSQVDSSRVRSQGGSGLGLAICARLARLMGGSIECESLEGRGSEFTLSLPLVAPKESYQITHYTINDEMERSFAEQRPLRILVAEDDNTNRLIICEMLKRLGYSPVTVTNGLDVLKMCEQEAFNLIFMDIHMPKMDGIEATQRLLSSCSTRPLPKIVALSADVLPESRERCMTAGMSGFLSKPITFDQLKSAIMQITPAADAD